MRFHTKLYKLGRTFLRGFLLSVKSAGESILPGTVIFVDPSKIQFFNTYGDIYKSGLVLSGDWDLDRIVFSETDRYKFIEARIKEGKSWKESGAIDFMDCQVAACPGYDGLYSMEDIKIRYRRLDKLIAGLRSGVEFLSGSNFTSRILWSHDHPMVNIDRHGDLMLSFGGHHRIAIAKCLGLHVVPVTVGVIHEDAFWTGLWKRNLISTK
jgi:hypothetical protein